VSEVVELETSVTSYIIILNDGKNDGMPANQDGCPPRGDNQSKENERRNGGKAGSHDTDKPKRMEVNRGKMMPN
jgi:hypothetical protein